jgi:integrase
MQHHPIHKDYHFEGKLAKICSDYVAEKRALGCIFNTEAKKLREFSRMSANYDLPSKTLPEELIKEWLTRRPNDSSVTHYHRFTIIKGLAEYMLRMGYKAYLPQADDIPKINRHRYVPYIFPYNEILSFFSVLDAMKKPKYSNSHRRHIVMPVIFRLLYCCGLRVSEVLNLTNEVIDLKNGILTIKDSKFEKSRYIPMSEEMTERLREYASQYIHEPYFFPSRDCGKYSNNSIYELFRQTLFAAGIPHRGRGKGPRVHDFRHTFAVHCLQKWIRKGSPLSSALPRLSTYLGHNSMAATEKYLRMTAEVYPEISKLLSKNYGHLIPKEVNK